jgi:hypothetical protein
VSFVEVLELEDDQEDSQWPGVNIEEVPEVDCKEWVVVLVVMNLWA